MVLYDFDYNAILATGIKSRKKEHIIRGFKEVQRKLTDAGIVPQLVKLDNESSAEMIKTIKIKNMSFQLAPPRDHRTNPAERSIRTFKDHFIATLFGIDDKYPGNQLYRFIKPSAKTLNILRGSRINPKLSAYQQIWYEFDYNTTPLASPAILATSDCVYVCVGFMVSWRG